MRVTPLIRAAPLLEGYVFIVTFGRSGSTLLQSIIGSIDGYCIRGENFHALQGLFKSYQCIERSYQQFRAAVRHDNPWFGAAELTPEIYGRRLSRLFVKEVLRPPPDCRILGFKEIRYFDDPAEFEDLIRFILRFFQPAKLILNTRNASEVSQSAWWRAHAASDVADFVSNANRLMSALARDRPESVCMLDYNEYSVDPFKLQAMFELLGEPFDVEKVRRIMSVRLRHGR